MANLLRLLKQWPTLHHHHCYTSATLHHIFTSPLLPLTSQTLSPLPPPLSLTTVPSSRRNVHLKSRGLRLHNEPTSSDLESSDSDSDSKKSRNQLKREARRAVLWGMDLASFSNRQIRRILRVASLDEEVFEAIMLAKRLGSDVREGKRRQFNYIGKLLREVQPELMDTLIQATKDGDESRLRALSDSLIIEDDDEEAEEMEEDVEEEGSDECISIATRWSEGLINKDIKITNEVYSVQSVEFDRQDLRKLIRRVHSIQDQQATSTEENKKEIDAAMMAARRSLNRFLHSLAKQMPSD
ncbi:uncharacterized protein LOC126712417 [Quercus robur]|uniref:uncharacterized protein LOC126712417 n=1 Tax=Quercus robur TaxID=38942 RepID=UPI002163BB26|nr:uncharacterized protein LOC126712417 [Quercus robur]